MGLLDNLAKRFNATVPATDQEAIAAYKERAYSFEDDFTSGDKLTKKKALKSSAVYASVRVISQAISGLPLDECANKAHDRLWVYDDYRCVLLLARSFWK